MSKRKPCGAIDDVTGKVAFWEGLYCEQVRESVDHMKATLHRGRDELRKAARRTSEMVALIHNASDEIDRKSVVEKPRACPACKSYHWRKPRKRKEVKA